MDKNMKLFRSKIFPINKCPERINRQFDGINSAGIEPLTEDVKVRYYAAATDVYQDVELSQAATTRQKQESLRLVIAQLWFSILHRVCVARARAWARRRFV